MPGPPTVSQHLIRTNSPDSIRKEPCLLFYSSNEFVIDDPKRGLEWATRITKANLEYLTKLRIFIPGVYYDLDFDQMLQNLRQGMKGKSGVIEYGPRWRAFFEKLAAGAKNLKIVFIYFDAEDTMGHYGGGADVDVVRAIGKLHGLEQLKIGGLFAKEWPGYLEQKTGLKVWDTEDQSEGMLRELRKFQRRYRDLKIE